MTIFLFENWTVLLVKYYYIYSWLALVCIFVDICVCMHVYMYVCIDVCMYVCVSMYVCIQTHFSLQVKLQPEQLLELYWVTSSTCHFAFLMNEWLHAQEQMYIFSAQRYKLIILPASHYSQSNTLACGMRPNILYCVVHYFADD